LEGFINDALSAAVEFAKDLVTFDSWRADGGRFSQFEGFAQVGGRVSIKRWGRFLRRGDSVEIGRELLALVEESPFGPEVLELSATIGAVVQV